MSGLHFLSESLPSPMDSEAAWTPDTTREPITRANVIDGEALLPGFYNAECEGVATVTRLFVTGRTIRALGVVEVVPIGHGSAPATWWDMGAWVLRSVVLNKDGTPHA